MSACRELIETDSLELGDPGAFQPQRVAASPHGAEELWDADLNGAIAVVIGSEHSGLSAVWDDARTVRIPMAGSTDSLNAATSAAVVLYEAHRQRSIAG